jgi:transcriptional regulator with XRE-family HTH domain
MHSAHKEFMHPGLRLRQARERLGLTYREVESASHELAARRGRSEFILHISRLAEIENKGVVPGLHKLYTLAVIYDLNPHEILRWYDIPIDECFNDGTTVPSPQTHIGTSDPRMVPLLRPGSIVLVDVSIRKIDDSDWTTEHDRPMYFVELRNGYRCGWFHRDGSRLVMQPHPLSHCLPEAWRVPEEAEVVGRVTGVATRLNGPMSIPPRESPAEREDSSRKAP